MSPQSQVQRHNIPPSTCASEGSVRSQEQLINMLLQLRPKAGTCGKSKGMCNSIPDIRRDMVSLILVPQALHGNKTFTECG